jgi:hypothetical protein
MLIDFIPVPKLRNDSSDPFNRPSNSQNVGQNPTYINLVNLFAHSQSRQSGFSISEKSRISMVGVLTFMRAVAHQTMRASHQEYSIVVHLSDKRFDYGLCLVEFILEVGPVLGADGVTCVVEA